MTPGFFIVFEGGEGSGKSTQAQLLAERLGSDGHEVIVTFEPGATDRGAEWRHALLDDHRPLDARAELLLMNADRAQHMAEVIRPALDRGAVVICDRHSPSSIVYQGIARGLGHELVAMVCAVATSDVIPDVVLVLDVSEAVARQRQPTAPDRIEAAGPEFHSTVRESYRHLAPLYGWTLVDGGQEVHDVATAVWSAVTNVRLGK